MYLNVTVLEDAFTWKSETKDILVYKHTLIQGKSYILSDGKKAES